MSLNALGPRILQLEKDEGLLNLQEAITKGRFTPFLGAGASSPALSHHLLQLPPWSEIASSIAAVAASLQVRLSRAAPASRYLRKFTEQRLNLAPEVADGLFTPGQSLSAALTTSRSRSHLAAFQCALVRFAVSLERAFSRSFTSSHPTSSSHSELRIWLDTADESYSESMLTLLEVIDEALTITSLDPAQIAPFDAHAIYRKLLLLAIDLLDERSWETSDATAWRQRHAAALDVILLIGDDRQHRISIPAEVPFWLSDLLWYSFSYLSPIYPTTSELAFELSLLDRFTRPRRTPLMETAWFLPLSTETGVDLVAAILSRREQTRSDVNHIHLAVAAAAYWLFLGWSIQRHSYPARPAALALSEEPWPLPLVLTTNFDRAIERAFDECQIAYHVVYPIRSIRLREEGRVHWAWKTHLPGPSDEPHFCSLTKCGGREFQISMIRGPVVVKLHGSPLDPALPEHEHWLVLSELTQLEAVTLMSSTMPEWLDYELRMHHGIPRSFWFLGHSLSDAHLKLWMMQGFRAQMPPPDINIITKNVDPSTASVLGALRICIYQGDLRHLPDIVLDVLQDVEPRDRILDNLLKRLWDVE